MLLRASAQIPNAGFESWVDMGGYTEPIGWNTYNDVWTQQGYFATCDPGTPGAVGFYHAMLTSRTVQQGTTPIQGWMSTSFAYTDRPAMLTGQWQYGIQPNDTGQVTVALVNSAASTSIALGTLSVTGNLSSWQLFQVPLTYFSTDIPDTAYIQIVSSIDFASPVAGSFVKVDDLRFEGSVGISEKARHTPVFLYPSPGTDVLNFKTSVPGTLQLLDTVGRVVLHVPVTSPVGAVDVSSLAPGLYTYRSTDRKGNVVATGRWVKG